MYKMKDSGVEWLGKIPAHWTIKTIGKLFTVKAGGDVKPLLYSYEKDKEHCYPVYTNTSDKNQVYAYTSKPEFPADTITVTGRGNIGHAIYRNIPYDAVIRLNVLIPKLNLDPKYYTYFIDIVVPFFSDSSAVAQLSASQIVSYKVCYLPIEEQEKISAYLDKKCTEIDKIIDLKKQQIDLLKEYRKTLISETITKGLNKDVEMKDSGVEWVGDIPEHWETIRLKYLIRSPLQYGANESGVEYDENLPRYIRITDITSDNKLKEINKLSLPYEIAKPYLLENNDILFARSGATVGKSFMYKSKYGISAFAGYLIKASIKKNVSPDFVYYYTLSSNYELWKEIVATQSTIQNIGADKYNNLIISLPPVEEQEKISSFLDKKCKEIDKIISLKNQQINLLQEYKKSLIYEYVTGKRKI